MRTRNIAPSHPGMILKRLYLNSLKIISKIVNGRGAITPEMALRLSRAFDTSPELWLNMQVSYDLWQASHSSNDWLTSRRLTLKLHRAEI